jgi:phospholipase C
MAKIVDRVVVFTQENHTTDNYFTSPQAGGAPSQLPGEAAPVVAGWLLFGRLEMNPAAAVR